MDFFKCENGCVRITFTEAYEGNFRCDLCNGILKPVDSIAESKQIKKETQQVKKMLEAFGPLPMSLEAQSV